MKIADTEKFEEKLRDVERSFGILSGHGVPVIYERHQDSSWIILMSLIAVALFTLALMKNVQIKGPQTMDFFVIIFFLNYSCFISLMLFFIFVIRIIMFDVQSTG